MRWIEPNAWMEWALLAPMLPFAFYAAHVVRRATAAERAGTPVPYGRLSVWRTFALGFTLNLFMPFVCFAAGTLAPEHFPLPAYGSGYLPFRWLLSIAIAATIAGIEFDRALRIGSTEDVYGTEEHQRRRARLSLRVGYALVCFPPVAIGAGLLGYWQLTLLLIAVNVTARLLMSRHINEGTSEPITPKEMEESPLRDELQSIQHALTGKDDPVRMTIESRTEDSAASAERLTGTLYSHWILNLQLTRLTIPAAVLRYLDTDALTAATCVALARAREGEEKTRYRVPGEKKSRNRTTTMPGLLIPVIAFPFLATVPHKFSVFLAIGTLGLHFLMRVLPTSALRCDYLPIFLSAFETWRAAVPSLNRTPQEFFTALVRSSNFATLRKLTMRESVRSYRVDPSKVEFLRHSGVDPERFFRELDEWAERWERENPRPE